jgi:multidrug efflux pump subunit AcrA (membrane-fusion protein)
MQTHLNKTKWILPVVAVALACLAWGSSLQSLRAVPEAPPPGTLPESPFGDVLAGEGMVEPSTESSSSAVIPVGTQLAGVVTRIHVHISEEVTEGQLLFELDKRQTAADLEVRLAALEAAKTQLQRLEQQPRPEEVPVSEAQVEAAEANVRQLEDQVERDKKLILSGAVTLQDQYAHLQAYLQGKAQLGQSRASLALLKAGAWGPDKVIAAAAVKQAEAMVAQDRTMLALLEVRAPVPGTILQINVHPGEYLTTNAAQSPIEMGNLHPLHVRVNIDEEDFPRLKLSAPAVAKVRGGLPNAGFPLKFVRLEPYIVPKVSLTGINIERVDTRVAQVIYAVDSEVPLFQEHKLLIGQLLDVFIDVSEKSAEPKGR